MGANCSNYCCSNEQTTAFHLEETIQKSNRETKSSKKFNLYHN